MSLDADKIESAVNDNAAGPRKVTGDSGSVEQHSLPDQIAALKFAAANKATAGRGGGFRYVKFRPPGAGGVDFTR